MTSGHVGSSATLRLESRLVGKSRFFFMTEYLNKSAFEVLARLEEEERLLAMREERTNWIIERKSGEWLYGYICDKKPKVIVECGTSVGYSTIWLAEAARVHGGRVISIEKELQKHLTAQHNIAEAGVENVELIHGDAREVLHAWTRGPIDFLFLDANKKGYLPQFLAAEPHLTEHAIVAADNVIDMKERVQDYIDYMHGHKEFETRMEHVGDGLLISRKR